jgi:TonB family protein
MAKPLRSEIKDPPNRQFAHFGVLDSGSQSKSAFIGSVVFNLILLLIAIVIGASVKKTIDDRKKLELTYVVPLKEKPPEPPKPKMPPPPKLPPPPKPIETPEPPKIKIPEVKLVEPPKPVPVAAPKPVPVVVPAPPKIQQAAAAPKVVAVTMAAKSASVVNNDPHPSEVRLGTANSPVPTQLKGPAVAAVNMNRGLSGMPPTNSGGGPPAKAVNLGNGSPGGQLGGTAVAKVEGVKIGGCIGCTGTGPGNGTKLQASQVGLGQTLAAAPTPAAVAKATLKTAPQVLFKPKPAYTADATNAHIEGTIVVKIKVAASGAVTVIGVQSGLGHGLDQSAIECAKGIKFRPAVDASGNPIDWEGVVNITFALA